MNCQPEHFWANLSARFRNWLQVAYYGINERDRARARRSVRRLLRAHPELADGCDLDFLTADMGTQTSDNQIA